MYINLAMLVILVSVLHRVYSSLLFTGLRDSIRFVLGVYLYVLLVYTVLCLLPVLYCVKFAENGVYGSV